MSYRGKLQAEPEAVCKYVLGIRNTKNGEVKLVELEGVYPVD